MKTVGILGGMGPEATVLLMQKIIAGVKAEDDRHHIPMIIHQNTQVPSRIKRLIEGNGDDPGPILKQMALDLQNMKCDFLAMPCNTAHYYHRNISECINVPLLDMIELSSQKLFKLNLLKIGILASPAVKKIGVFDKSFKKFGLEGNFPTIDRNMLKIIQCVKKGQINNDIIDLFKCQVFELVDLKCDGILIACTELSLLRKYVPTSIPCLDSLDCLADNVIENAIKN